MLWFSLSCLLAQLAYRAAVRIQAGGCRRGVSGEAAHGSQVGHLQHGSAQEAERFDFIQTAFAWVYNFFLWIEYVGTWNGFQTKREGTSLPTTLRTVVRSCTSLLASWRRSWRRGPPCWRLWRTQTSSTRRSTRRSRLWPMWVFTLVVVLRGPQHVAQRFSWNALFVLVILRPHKSVKIYGCSHQ